MTTHPKTAAKQLRAIEQRYRAAADVAPEIASGVAGAVDEEGSVAPTMASEPVTVGELQLATQPALHDEAPAHAPAEVPAHDDASASTAAEPREPVPPAASPPPAPAPTAEAPDPAREEEPVATKSEKPKTCRSTEEDCDEPATMSARADLDGLCKKHKARIWQREAIEKKKQAAAATPTKRAPVAQAAKRAAVADAPTTPAAGDEPGAVVLDPADTRTIDEIPPRELRALIGEIPVATLVEAHALVTKIGLEPVRAIAAAWDQRGARADR